MTTEKAAAFIVANAASRVVSGRVINQGGEGAHYTLQNGECWELTAEDCLSLPDGSPIWFVPKDVA